LKKNTYLLDTHALVFWSIGESVSSDFIEFFDNQDSKANLLVSSISFWEIALLVKKGKIDLKDTNAWCNELTTNTNLQIINPTSKEMIDSTLLPDHHKDPFDRLLISQTLNHGLTFVSRDKLIRKYDVPVFWI
jgi:PIN domain nuclease of toxin-antitoxin system